MVRSRSGTLRGDFGRQFSVLGRASSKHQRAISGRFQCGKSRERGYDELNVIPRPVSSLSRQQERLLSLFCIDKIELIFSKIVHEEGNHDRSTHALRVDWSSSVVGLSSKENE